jgi:hypothetical protein
MLNEHNEHHRQPRIRRKGNDKSGLQRRTSEQQTNVQRIDIILGVNIVLDSIYSVQYQDLQCSTEKLGSMSDGILNLGSS